MSAADLNVSPFKMRRLVFFLVAMGGFVGCALASPLPSLAGVDRVEIWDRRTQDIHAKPRVFTNAQIIAQVVAIVQKNDGAWQSGAFTEPSGYLRLVFVKSSRMIAAVGVGPHFLVFGASDNWYSNQLDADDEANLQRIANSTPN